MPQSSHPPLVLASASPYRVQQLTQLGLKFTQKPANIDETPQTDESAEQLAKRLAVDKAQLIAQRHPQAIVIGSDQVGLCRDRIVGKPGSRSRAIEQLTDSSDQMLTFYTAVCVISPDDPTAHCHCEQIDVRIRPLSHEEIERYVDIDQPFHCAGAFKMESLGISLFESIESRDPSALIGLPLIGLSRLLRQAGLSLP